MSKKQTELEKARRRAEKYAIRVVGNKYSDLINIETKVEFNDYMSGWLAGWQSAQREVKRLKAEVILFKDEAKAYIEWINLGLK